jgi:hypothetical protein
MINRQLICLRKTVLNSFPKKKLLTFYIIIKYLILIHYKFTIIIFPSQQSFVDYSSGRAGVSLSIRGLKFNVVTIMFPQMTQVLVSSRNQNQQWQFKKHSLQLTSKTYVLHVLYLYRTFVPCMYACVCLSVCLSV